MAVRVSRTTYPHISIDRKLSGGPPLVEGTRIPVATLVRAHQLGMEFDEILVQYPTLRPAQLHAALAYYHDHRASIDRLIARNDRPPRGATIVRQ